jgi:hypothetical protein
VLDGTNTWTYTTATVRQANGATANQLDFIVGLDESPVTATVLAHFSNTNVGVAASIGIGLDSTTTASHLFGTEFSHVAAHVIQLSSTYSGFTGIGRHFLAWLEHSAATGATTWYGDNGGTLIQSGIVGSIMG